MRFRIKSASLFPLLMICLLSVAHAEHPDDPWESVNREIFAFNETIDGYVLKPVAKGYRAVTPGVVDKAVTNFFGNLDDVTDLANHLLQLKFEDAILKAGRITFNTVFGIGGLFDVSTGFGLPDKDEDFGQTLNYWGVPEGNYLVLPLLGPATVTDAFGRIPDTMLSPDVFESPDKYYAKGLELVDLRADIIPSEGLLSGDRYTAIRNVYLQRRDFLINDGKVESDPFLQGDEDFSDF